MLNYFAAYNNNKGIHLKKWMNVGKTASSFKSLVYSFIAYLESIAPALIVFFFQKKIQFVLSIFMT